LSADYPAPGGLGAGSRIAGYRIESRIGAGGMAVVYRAHDERLGRPVALKVMASQWTGGEKFRRRFAVEARAAAAVDHPHIIPVYEAGEADGVLFIAMRAVTGSDSRGVLRRLAYRDVHSVHIGQGLLGRETPLGAQGLANRPDSARNAAFHASE
jgi:serine/threonine protein kinase